MRTCTGRVGGLSPRLLMSTHTHTHNPHAHLLHGREPQRPARDLLLLLARALRQDGVVVNAQQPHGGIEALVRAVWLWLRGGVGLVCWVW
jgi:hypothetical protein